MSELDKARMRREAVDTVGSRPPTASGSRIDAALRRYLGVTMSTMLSRDKGRGRGEREGTGADGPTKQP